jgi:hypothetical protein
MVSSGMISGGFGELFVRSGVRKQSVAPPPPRPFEDNKKAPAGAFPKVAMMR